MARGLYGVVLATAFVVYATVARAATLASIVPAVRHATAVRCAGDSLRLATPLRFPRNVDAGGFAVVRERWRALGIALPVRASGAEVVLARTPTGWNARPGVLGVDERYALRVGSRGVVITSRTSAGEFDALATLAQLATGRGRDARVPCVAIADAPALRWRIVSDDVSRGPFPTMRYLRERIRALASLKINGWSPYMEEVIADPRYPYLATPNRWTPAQLAEIARYARRFHVTLIPEQQTFAHMHAALQYESLAAISELPHGWLIAPARAASVAYLEPLVRSELRATPGVPFFHLGADEPIDLGAGPTPRTPAVFAAHVNALGAVVRGSGARPMIWDDAVLQTPAILDLLDPRTAIVSFHYGAERSFRHYLRPLLAHGFTTFVAPGAANWNELYSDLTTAYANIAPFVRDGQAANVSGMFATVWHDDGETLYEATWPAVAFAAASAWQRDPVDRATWHADFARAFYGGNADVSARDLDALARMRDELRTTPAGDPSDYLFWHDPFDARVLQRASAIDTHAIRLQAEAILARSNAAHPPLHRAAFDAMRLAAWRYDVLGRRLQIAREARDDYAAARRAAATHDDAHVYRNLNLAKYLCWELRDEMTALAPAYAHAWLAESTQPGLARILVRFAAAAQQAQLAADRIDGAEREDYLRGGTLPPFDDVVGRGP